MYSGAASRSHARPLRTSFDAAALVGRRTCGGRALPDQPDAQAAPSVSCVASMGSRIKFVGSTFLRNLFETGTGHAHLLDSRPTMPKLRRPHVASPDEVKITRNGDYAEIEYADPRVAST